MRRWAGSGLVDSGKARSMAGNSHLPQLSACSTVWAHVFGLKKNWCVGWTGTVIHCHRFLVTGS